MYWCDQDEYTCIDGTWRVNKGRFVVTAACMFATDSEEEISDPEIESDVSSRIKKEFPEFNTNRRIYCDDVEGGDEIVYEKIIDMKNIDEFVCLLRGRSPLEAGKRCVIYHSMAKNREGLIVGINQIHILAPVDGMQKYRFVKYNTRTGNNGFIEGTWVYCETSAKVPHLTFSGEPHKVELRPHEKRSIEKWFFRPSLN